MGAVIGGAIGAWLVCRHRGYSFPLMADAAAPAVALAQAIGRWGCYFNQELYGRPSTLPWAVRIDPAHRPVDSPDVATYQPTFLYESLRNLSVAGIVVWADRRWRLDQGRVFALYAALYTAGRGFIETLRIDPATHLLGVRINVWTSAVIFLTAVAYLIVVSRRPGPGEPPRVSRRVGCPASGCSAGWL